MYCDYDIECKKKYLYCNSLKINKINLDLNFDYLSFSDYYNETNSNLVINSVIVTGGIGGAGGPGLLPILSFIFLIKDIIIYIYNFIKSLFTYFCPFVIIKNKYGFGKKFVFDIINYSETWNYGFMNLDKVKFKKILEKVVMRKFGYKKKNKKWHKSLCFVNSKGILKKYSDC